VVTGYPIGGKPKSQQICLDFVRSCGGQVAGELRDGPAFFYGVVAGANKDIFDAARARAAAGGAPIYYCDNSYFDAERQQSFRITRNRLQHTGIGISTCERFDRLAIDIQPWRDVGQHIVVCPQSDPFMRDVVGYPGDWLADVTAELNLLTQRPLRIRHWNRDKGALAATLGQDLAGAHALVTWSSAAAVTAILAGIPAFVMSPDCAAAPMSAGPLSQINSPLKPTGRRDWAGVLADNEWSISEIRDGTAWRMLNAQE